MQPTPTPLSEQFKSKAKNDNPYGDPYPVWKLSSELHLASVKQGFVITKRQFNHLAEVLYPYTLPGYGLWSLQFHPKSGHIVHDRMMQESFVYPTKALSEDFNYFRWSFNGLFCADWIKFNKIIKDTDCEYVLFKQETCKLVFSVKLNTTSDGDLKNFSFPFI